MKKQEKLQLLNQQNFLVLDTETTGLGEDAEIIELAILNKKGDILFNSLIKPKNGISNEATAIHGITNQCVKDAPSFIEVIEEITAILYKQYVVAHNAVFDSKMLSSEFKKLNRQLHVTWFCSMLLITPENSKWLRLGEALSALNISYPKNGNAHRALYDAECARIIINTLIEKMIYKKKKVCLTR